MSAAAVAGAAAVVFHGRQALVLLSGRERFGPQLCSGGGRSKTSSSAVPKFAAEGPSCIFIGPIEKASQETLEALYHQARDSYYSGKPLIVDDMFDKVELKLRLYGSKSVVKYPRCSLRKQSTYADADEDPSQVFALASIWILLLAFGGVALLVPTFYSINQAYQDLFGSTFYSSGESSSMEWLSMTNGMLFAGLGCCIGYPIASASGEILCFQALQGLWRNDLVALKGSCPNCGEEVFAFVKAEKSNQPAHRTECHVCECQLEFRTKVERTISTPKRRWWVYGRVYLVRRKSSRR